MPTTALWLYIAAINLVTLAAFRFDKARAVAGMRRVPERDLLLLVALGGTIGGWAGMRLFRHKTRKTSFSAAFFMIAVAQAIILMLIDMRP
ncbi:DUF1294 domain-containing protein [Sphingobium lignivorans]|uniref:Uncharacterized membrane protein YsdA (DUF1294 family) n=1 Tax=Sphingobium lignivorans TaxID=2735886 RepID=A0ABR6NFH7_9SPHN|nr:DUF1294 domain-containing protein [Sphingobium lignivorans]MBB5986043.1 uncharacterized membrane protein YsdA (DUF1294 family) [Sphingobium lignivorans]